MKLKLLFIAISVAFIFAACKKSASTTSGSFTGTVSNNTSFNFTGSAVAFTRDTISGTPAIEIIGTSQSPAIVAGIGLANVSTTGTYPLLTLQSTSNQGGLVEYEINSNHAYASIATATNPGTVTVTTLNSTTIAGTYSAIVTDSLNKSLTITGSFNGTFSK